MGVDGVGDDGLTAALLAAAPADVAKAWAEEATLGSRLSAMVDDVRAAWPEFDIPATVFASFVGERLTADDTIAMEGLHLGDLYLVCGCLHGLAPAVAAFEAEVFRDLAAIVARADFGGRLALDDVRQTLRHQLLVRDPSRRRSEAKLANYSGRGTLENWFRVVAMRVTHNLARANPHEASTDTDRVADFVGTGQSVELDYLREHYRDEFRSAFSVALEGLGVEDRNFLRMHYVDGVSVEALATMHGVHRVTMSRRLAKVRNAIGVALRRELSVRLRVDRAELQSILRLVRSRLDLSLRRHLASPDE